MPVKMLDIKDVHLHDSRFTLQDYIVGLSCDPPCQLSSFQALGILYPIIVYQDSTRKLHLVDGAKRMQYAVQSGQRTIGAMIIPETCPISDIISLIICNKRHEVESSIINKVMAVCFALELDAPEEWIFNVLCATFDFKPHSEFLRECERIRNLPREFKEFCHDKRISLKQILNFTYYPRDLLETVIRWKTVLHLTASTVDEIASGIHDYMRRENKKLSDLMAEPDVEEIFDSSLRPREKTDQFRRLLKQKKYPILGASNRRIEKIVASMNLPRNVHVSWDRTLENRNVDVHISLNDPRKWSKILTALQSSELKESMASILEEF